jgi:TolB-like protein
VRPLRFGLALALLFAAPGLVRAQQPVTVAILPLSGFAMGMDAASQAAMATAVRDMLITEFAQTAKLKPIERSAVDDLMKSRNLSLSGQISDADAKMVGQLLGAEYWIGGGMTIAGSTARMDLRLVHTETSEVTNTFKEPGKKDDMIQIVELIAARFTSNLKVKPKVADVVVPVPSAFAYARGLDYEKRGDRKKAADMYATALKLFPDNAAAKAALDRVK